METERPRVDRRRARTPARILEVAARRFAERGFEEVRLDHIAEEADVARGTLYSHFDSKDALVTAILRPLLEHATAEVQALGALSGRDALRGLTSVYLDLWQRHRDALRLSYQLQARPLGELAQLHGAFLRGVLQVLEAADREGLLRVGSPVLAARVMSRVAVPLLELYAGRPGAESLFIESIEGLLLRG
jgi:AcrR family transcriptional regulator